MGKLFEELKRRKVFRVAAVYAVVSWVVIQVADTLFPALQLPEWTVTFISVLLILGFFPTMVVAWAYERTAEGIRPDHHVQASTGSPATSAQPVNYMILAIVLLVAVFQVTDRFVFAPSGNSEVTANSESGSNSSRPTRRYDIYLGAISARSGFDLNVDVALSSDGRRLAIGLQEPGSSQQIYMRELDQVQAVLLDGTEGGDHPAFSPDGEWIVFNGDETLQKISVRGGSAIVLADDMAEGTSAYWTEQDQIYYSRSVESVDRLIQISANGGIPAQVEIDQSDTVLRTRWPYLLPDNKSLLYTASPGPTVRNGYISLLNLENGSTRPLIQSAYNARYVPTGHIAFIRAESLWAVPFDLQSLEITGPEVPVIPGLHTDGFRGGATYSFSDDGLLVYLPGGDIIGSGDEDRTLHWIDREGNQQTLSLSRNFGASRLSPDGQKLAVTINDGNNADVWVYDLVRNSLSRLTFDEARDANPIWTVDGQRIIFSSNRDESGEFGLWWRAADGTGQPERLLAGFRFQPIPTDATPDGTELIYDYDSDLYALTIGDENPQLLVQSEGNQFAATVSPNGRFITYTSNESGISEIYVRPYPNVEDGRWQVSIQGGAKSRWNATGDELYFEYSLVDESGQRSLAVWSVTTNTEGSGFQYGEPAMLFMGNYLASPTGLVVSPDGSRFLMMQDAGQETVSGETSLKVVDNWFAELNRLAPPSQQ